VVFDCVFHPDTLRMRATNQKFSSVLLDTVMDAVEQRGEYKVDRQGKPSLSST
jgi:hypothetical protein